MSFLVIAACFGLCLAPQSSPPPSSGGTTSGVASKSRGGGCFSLFGGTNVRVSSPSSDVQFSPMVAVDPADRLHLVGGAIDGRNLTSHSLLFELRRRGDLERVVRFHRE